MMGGSCSRPSVRRNGGGRVGCTRRGHQRRSRSFSSAVGRFCGSGGSQGDSSDDENRSAKFPTKRAARHSVDAEVPNRSIAHLFPLDDNYVPHPTDPTLRCPKSLASLCIDAVCRTLPNLDGELPPHLPQEVVDRIAANLTRRAALNSTTLRALRRCELGELSLANCRGVSDEWLRPSMVGDNDDDDEEEERQEEERRPRSASSASVPTAQGHYQGDGRWSPPHSSPSHHPARFVRVTANSASTKMDLDDLDDDDCDDSHGSRSTSSFATASSTHHRVAEGKGEEEEGTTPPHRPHPPPGFLSLEGSPRDGPYDAMSYDEDEDEHKYEYEHGHEYEHEDQPVVPSAQLRSLDLRGSQRLTDRGLLRLGHARPLASLESVRLDGCHGIVGRGLLAFSHSAMLRTLSLANCRRLTDEAVVNVGHLGGSLACLNLGGCRCLTDRSLEAVGNLTGLRKLDLSQCDLITDDGLANLHGLELLDELSIGWCRRISDDGLEVLAAQPNRSASLVTLRLARCSITDRGVLNALALLENLEELDLNGCVRVTGAALGEALGRLPRLASLDASYCPGVLRGPSWQGRIDGLRSLELCYSGVRDSHLARLRSLPRLEELNLDSCAVGDWGVAHLVDNGVVPNLTMLDLADTDVSDAAMGKIAMLRKIRHLSLFYCNISNRGLRHIASMSSLEVLNLDSRDIGDEGLRYLRGLPLKSLDLFSSRVTDIGCAHLSKIKTLTSLELCGGGIGDFGCAHLASLHSLTSLNLSQNESVTNRGAAALAALAELKALNLSNTCVTPDALRFFGGLRKLQSLALYGCKDMEDGAAEGRLEGLQSELPSLRCLRLNSPSNEDGVIDHDVEMEEEEGDEDDDDDAYYDELDDEDDELDDEDDELDGESEEGLIAHVHRHHVHQLIGNDDNGDIMGSSSSEDGNMSDFQDAFNELQSVDSASQQSRNMDYNI